MALRIAPPPAKVDVDYSYIINRLDGLGRDDTDSGVNVKESFEVASIPRSILRSQTCILSATQWETNRLSAVVLPRPVGTLWAALRPVPQWGNNPLLFHIAFFFFSRSSYSHCVAIYYKQQGIERLHIYLEL